MNPITNSKLKRYLNVCFQIRQPRRLPPHGFFDSAYNDESFDDGLNRNIIREVARNCYHPVNLMLLKLIHQHPKLRITFSVSGVALEQLEKYCPAVIESFRMLASTDSVEFLGETYNETVYSQMDQEFTYQVKKHIEIMDRLLGVKPTVFRGTELIYSDHLVGMIHQLGFKGIYTDGSEKIVRARTLNWLYNPHASAVRPFLPTFQHGNDIAFRFSDKVLKEHALPEYMSWIEQGQLFDDNLMSLGMDCETFGRDQKNEPGSLHFLEDLLTKAACSKKIDMINPTRVMHLYENGLINSCRHLPISDHFYNRPTRNDTKKGSTVMPGKAKQISTEHYD